MLGLSDGVNISSSFIVTGLARFMDPPKKERVPPDITDVSFTKDAKGSVAGTRTIDFHAQPLSE